MNSPLNPDAAEFIPVFPTATSEEYSPETPVKSVPHDLSDIVASSPNWMHMENVTVPEESTFLEDIKSRPTNVFEDVSTPQKENFNNLKTEESQVANAFPDAITTEETENLREAVVSSTEVGGISWANDMTSSFIDPYSIGFKKEVIEDAPKQQDNERHEKLDEDKEHFEQLQHQEHSAQSPHPEHQERRDHLGFDPVEVMEPIIEQKKVFLTNETPHLQEPDQLESESVSSIAEKEIVSPVSPTPVTSDFSGVEAPLSPVSEPSTAEVQPSDLLGTKAEEPVKTVLTPPSAPLANEELNSDFEQSSKTTEIPLKEEDKLNEVIAVAGATAAVAGVITSVGAVKQDTDRKPSPKTAPNKTTKTTTPKPLMNGTKTSAKKPLGSAQPVKSTVTTKTVSHNTSATSPTKTSVSRVSTVTKTTLKSASPVTSTLSKTQARTKPSTPPVVSKSPITKAVTSTTSAKSSTVGSKPPARVSGTTPATAATKSKPRVSSAPIEKKTTATLNGDARTVLKRTETTTTTKKPNSTTSSMTVTRVSLTSRPATAPAKSTTAKTTITTTKTMTAKPRTTLSSTTTTTSTVTTTTRVSTGSKKPILGADKQAKEAANRLTSKTGMMAKTNGIGPGKPAQTLTKVRKSLTTTSSTPSKTKTDSKTEIKAEKIINNSVEIIQSENEMPLIENNKDINLINSMASD